MVEFSAFDARDRALIFANRRLPIRQRMLGGFNCRSGQWRGTGQHDRLLDPFAVPMQFQQVTGTSSTEMSA